MLDHVKRVFENIGVDELKLQRSYVENKSLTDILKESKMQPELFRKYNPHITTNITAKTPVNTITKIAGWEEANYDNNQSIWKEWQELKMPRWDTSSVNTLREFQEEFKNQGVLTMYAALEEVIQTTNVRQKVTFRQEPLISYLNRLETQRPWMNQAE